MTAARARLRTGTTVVLATGLGLPLVMGTAAQADPARGERVSLTCGSTTYDVVVQGNGDFTPAHDLNSTLVFIPHTFIGFHGVVLDTAGNVVATFDDPSIQTQGSGKQKNDTVCSFTIREVSDGSDPEFPAGYTFVGTGGVSGQTAGHARGQ